MDVQLAGDVAVIVGGANGIGWAIARAFAAERALVALIDRDPQTVDKARRLAAETETAALGWTADVTNYQAMREACDLAVEQRGHVRHVVFAAGAGSGQYGFPFWDLQPSHWSRVLEINLVGAVNVAHAFAQELRRSQPSTMLFISSVAAQIGSQTDPPYSAAKAGLLNFAECAAKDLAPYNVRVNSICPGMIRTELNRAVWSAWNAKQAADRQIDYETWAEEKIRRVVPLGRWQTPEDVAVTAVFLASPLAGNITGQTLNVDGGQVMHW